MSAIKLVHQAKKLGSRDRPLEPKGGPRRGDPAVERGVGGVAANNLKPKRRFQNFTLQFSEKAWDTARATIKHRGANAQDMYHLHTPRA